MSAPIARTVVSVMLDETLQPLQVTLEKLVDHERVTYVTYDACPFDNATEAFADAVRTLPAEQRLW